MEPILTIIFFVFGLIIGSFLNVVIFRYHTHKTFGGRSICLSCQNRLYWYDLVPLLSYTILGGRCRHCKAKISIQYPLVELASGLIFLGLFIKFQDIFYINIIDFSITYAYFATMFSLLLVIASYDLRHKIIPDTLSFIFGILAFVGMFFFNASSLASIMGDTFYFHIPALWDFLAGIVLSLPFALFWLLSRGTWMGLGDAKLAVGLGFLLGLGRALTAVTLSFWSGAIVGIYLIIFSGKHKMKSEIPFAPFLVLGAVLAFIFELHLFPF